MELVYLWVEEYKNIKNQGFNFSPRFTCKYDKDKNELTIEEKKDYVSIFPDNINMTAIVGENGSGKSSISGLLVEYSYQEFSSNNKKGFLVFFDGEKFLFKQGFTGKTLDFNIQNNTAYTYENQNKPRSIDTIYFSNDVASIFNNPDYAFRLQRYSHLDAYYEEKKTLMPSNKYITSNEKKEKLETFNKRLQSLLSEDEKILSFIQNKLVFNSYKRELHFYEIGAYITGNKDFLQLLNLDKLSGNTVFKDSMDLEEHFLKLLILFRLREHFWDNEVGAVINSIKDEFNTKNFELSNCMKIFEVINPYDKKNHVYTKKNIQDILDKFEYLKNEIWVEKKTNTISSIFKTSNELLNILLENINRTNYFNSKDSTYTYFSLSSGEREYISIFVAFIHHLKRVNKNLSVSENEFIFLFDEIDLGLHPNWQKNLIKDLIYFAKKNTNKKVQIIVTSHSPFILSDIPKENVIFLENGKQVYPNIETFGANIHTLLSHGFFMKDGLMGEFAKSKINEVIDYLNGKNSPITDDDEAQRYIRIIGEPIVKKQLQRMLDSKKLDKMKEIDALKNQIESLQSRLENLEKKS
ncbi:AAA family ATPase [Sulfurospirillum multivorans]|uniref:ATPase domain-containing protein n=2 Tax=Sulfurospirillum multivorans TaxID=66821 RepID=A0AA86AND3_SULMK|nr:AAA family ATPase [Sulfurospirillum multivorans]AHJ13474.1 ATPase domain-containing protein [Sulfurospirillum multivorans DSM 12446]QEH06964.1 ATPase domain-containing protein [Sulfurospirillum multivorans]